MQFVGKRRQKIRSREVLEEQLNLVVNDRGQTLQKLRSSELANQLLQKKLRDLQKWHNELEFKLFKCRDYTNNGNGSLSSRTNTSSSDVERNET